MLSALLDPAANLEKHILQTFNSALPLFGILHFCLRHFEQKANPQFAQPS